MEICLIFETQHLERLSIMPCCVPVDRSSKEKLKRINKWRRKKIMLGTMLLSLMVVKLIALHWSNSFLCNVKVDSQRDYLLVCWFLDAWYIGSLWGFVLSFVLIHVLRLYPILHHTILFFLNAVSWILIAFDSTVKWFFLNVSVLLMRECQQWNEMATLAGWEAA